MGWQNFDGYGEDILMTSIRVTLPNGELLAVIDNVPDNTTCESIKSRLLGIYDLNGKFELHSNGKVLHDSEILTTDTVTLVSFGPKHTNPYLAVAFILGHLIPIAYLIQGKRISECLYASVVGFWAFLVIKFMIKKPFSDGKFAKFIPSQNIVKDLCSLYIRSLIPSFRVEQLLINE